MGASVFDVTILLPCLNERLTLPGALGKAREAQALLEKRGLKTELLVSDNGSTDGSPELAVQHGARVTHCPARGYGNALIHGCREAKGRYVLMGDSDGSHTVDFIDITTTLANWQLPCN